MRKSAYFLAAIASFGLASQAHAAAYCSGGIYEAVTYDSGDIMILSAWRNDWTVVCNLNTPRGTISPSTCFAWFAQVQTAITAKKPMGIYFYTIEQSQCATMPTYGAAPTPGYVRTTPTF